MIKVSKTMDMVVKSNKLVESLQTLSLSEIRLIQLAIVDSRNQVKGLTSDTPLRIDALRYAEIFGVSRQTAYEVLKEAESTLFKRYFTFLSERNNKVRTHWIQQAEYIEGEGAIEIIFTVAVVAEITRIDGYVQMFTQYALSQIANLNSIYSVRLYELLKQWTTAKTARFEINTFREQLGIGINEYKAMSDFKRRVLDVAVKEINEKTDIKVSYDQQKKGRTITSFKFKILANTNHTGVKDKENTSNSLNVTTKSMKPMTSAQVELFARLLADDASFNSSRNGLQANVGEKETEYLFRVKQNLSDYTNQVKWLEYLEGKGFKPQRH